MVYCHYTPRSVSIEAEEVTQLALVEPRHSAPLIATLIVEIAERGGGGGAL